VTVHYHFFCDQSYALSNFICVFNDVEALKEIIRVWRLNPEQLLSRDALTEGATSIRNQEEIETHQLTVLGEQLKQLIQQAAATSEKG